MEKEAVMCAVLVFVTASAGVSQNSEVSCPSSFFKEGSSILHLTILNSTFSICYLKPSVVTCRWDSGDMDIHVICQSSVTHCEKYTAKDRCRCVEENGQGFKYSFKFMFPNLEQVSIYCDLDCAVLTPSAPTATIDSSEQCLNITFVSKCFGNGQCKRGTCRINENNDDICDCTGTRYVGTFCEKLDPFLVALICVSTLLGVVMTAVGAGVYCARKQKSGGQQNAPPADAPPANAPQVNDPCYSAPQVNDPRYNTLPQVNYSAPPDYAPQVNYSTPPDNNAPPDNTPQVAGSAGPSTGQTVPTKPDDESYESSVAGSEASEGTEYSASEASEV